MSLSIIEEGQLRSSYALDHRRLTETVVAEVIRWHGTAGQALTGRAVARRASDIIQEVHANNRRLADEAVARARAENQEDGDYVD